MAQQVVIAGAMFEDVPSISVPDANNVYHPFLDTTIASNAAAASDIAQGKLAYVNGSLVTGTNQGGGGSSNWTLLKTESIGAVNCSSTSAVSLNKSISVTGCNVYDLIVVYTSVGSLSANSHGATAQFVYLGNSKNNNAGANARVYWNAYTNSSSELVNSRNGTTSYGVYASGLSISNGTLTLPMYAKYSSSNTLTINGTYTTKVYGVKLFDLYGA